MAMARSSRRSTTRWRAPLAVKGYFDSIAYTDRGLPHRIEYANGASTEMMWDDLLRLESKVNKDASG